MRRGEIGEEKMGGRRRLEIRYRRKDETGDDIWEEG